MWASCPFTVLESLPVSQAQTPPLMCPVPSAEHWLPFWMIGRALSFFDLCGRLKSKDLVSILLLRACLKVRCRSWSVRGRDWGLACRRSYSPSSTMATGHGLGSLLICQTLLSVDRFPGGPGCKSPSWFTGPSGKQGRVFAFQLGSSGSPPPPHKRSGKKML